MTSDDTAHIVSRERADDWFGGYIASCGVCGERLRPFEIDDGLCRECKEEGW